MISHIPPSETLSMSSLKSNERSKVRLPKLEVQKFNGDIIKFRGFWDQFQSAIHNNDDLSDIEKFTYLKSVLFHTAAELVSGLALSSTNYEKAVELLKERFGNTQTLISAHMDALVRIPRVENIAHVTKLRAMYDTLESGIRNLNDLKVSTSTYGSLLINIVFERIPEELKILISRNFKGETLALDDLLKIFKEELLARERCMTVGANRKTIMSEPMTTQVFQVDNKSKDFQNSCVYCGQAHLYLCTTLRDENLKSVLHYIHHRWPQNKRDCSFLLVK